MSKVLEVERENISWHVVPETVTEKFTRDFDSHLFDIYTPREEIIKSVTSYMGEKLFMPGYQEIRISLDGALDPDYLSVMQKSIDYWYLKGDVEAAYRFEMELVGMKRLAWAVSQRVQADKNDPARYIVGSDPGNTYKTAEGAKSVVFVGEVKEITSEGIIYSQYAIPLDLLELLTLYEKISKVAEIEIADLTAENLVAYAAPLVGALNEVAETFGQGGWDLVVSKAADQLRLEKDAYGKERREELINYYSELIYQALQKGRDREYLNTIDESMRRVFALEAGADKLLGLRPDHVRAIVEQNIIDVKAEQLGIFSRHLDKTQIAWFEEHYQVSITDIMEYRGWMLDAFKTNPLARRALVTGCGGGVNIKLNDSQYGSIESWVGGYGYEQPTGAGFEMMTSFGYSETVVETSETLNDGDTACYRCPVCESEGHNPGGEVKRRGGYLVCQDKPDKHRIEYSSSG